MKIGSVIASRFRIDRVVGRGAMGVVVEAMDLTSGHRVAVKLILPQYAIDQQLRGRFIREANVMSRLQSEHVARVFDAGELDDGTLFLAMEYLEGQSLEDLVKSGGPLPVMDAVDLMLEALDAIAEAHQLGLVHRDLKPSNLFLAARPEHAPIVKVLDFGIVKDLADHSALTTRGTLPGTPAYMAPEQIMLQTSKVDARADIWAIGVTLYEILTGTLPFTGPMQTMLTRIRSEPAPRLRATRPDITPALEDIVDRCLAKQPERRFASGAELMAALADLRRLGLGPTSRVPAPTVRKGDSVPRRSDADFDVSRGGEVAREAGTRGRGTTNWLVILLCSSMICAVIGILFATRSATRHANDVPATHALGTAPPVVSAPPTETSAPLAERSAPPLVATLVEASAPATSARRGPRRVKIVSALNTGDRAWKAWLDRHRTRIETCAAAQMCPATLTVRMTRDGGGTTVNVEPGAGPGACPVQPSVVDCVRRVVRERVPPPDVCAEGTECRAEVLLSVD